VSILIGKAKKQKKSDVTRDRIKMAACDIFEKSGYGAVTVGKIMEIAGLAKGTFYIYFKNTDDILTSICKDSLQSFVENMSELPFYENKYEDIYNIIYFNVKDTAEKWKFELSFIAYSLDNPELSEFIHTKRIEFGKITANRMLRHQDDISQYCLSRDDDDLVSLVTSLNCMVAGYLMDAFRALKPNEKPKPKDLQRLAQFLADVFYRAVYLSAPPKSS
jgi:AcrR family transcriptional regulator